MGIFVDDSIAADDPAGRIGGRAIACQSIHADQNE